jgi:WD and tetratricopeptide repeat-containing protein 1
VNDRVVEDINDAAYANQKRMNSNPFEVILMNMGYRLSSGAEEEGSEDDAVQEDGPIQMPCNPS